MVVNGNASGAGDPERMLAEVVRHLGPAGERADGRVTSSEAELRDALGENGHGRVVLVGGDGTLHSALNLGLPLPEIALVPVGRANNVARALGLPQDVAEAARVAASGTARPLDVLRVETDRRTLYCVEGVSAGIQADARARYHGENSADLRAGVEAFARALRDYHPYPVDLSVDGQPGFVGEAAQIFLSNLPYFAFGFRVDPVAQPDDGLLEAIVMEAASRRRVARLLISAYRGTHLERAGVTLRRAREVLIRSRLPLTGDGQPLEAGCATVSVEQGLLRIAS